MYCQNNDFMKLLKSVLKKCARVPGWVRRSNCYLGNAQMYELTCKMGLPLTVEWFWSALLYHSNCAEPKWVQVAQLVWGEKQTCPVVASRVPIICPPRIGAHSSNREVKERKHPRAEFDDERHLLWQNFSLLKDLMRPRSKKAHEYAASNMGEEKAQFRTWSVHGHRWQAHDGRCGLICKLTAASWLLSWFPLYIIGRQCRRAQSTHVYNSCTTIYWMERTVANVCETEHKVARHAHWFPTDLAAGSGFSTKFHLRKTFYQDDTNSAWSCPSLIANCIVWEAGCESILFLCSSQFHANLDILNF